MLYTFSQADYAQRELEGYFANITENDAVVLWQDGVLLAIKYPHCFEQCPAECLLLEQDILARNLTSLLPRESKVRSITTLDFVAITQKFYPQVAL